MIEVKEAISITTPSDLNRFNKFKVLAHSERINMIIENEIPPPVEWVIYPSNVCGYKCSHCIMAKTQEDHKARLSKEAMFKIANDAKDWMIKTVIYSGGGDPLLNPWTLESARRVKSNGIKVGINNQGFHLTDPTPFDFVRYSVDAGSRETYLKIHGVDGWERVERNIANHAKLRKKGEKIELGLAYLITPWNDHEIEKFVEWGQRFDPDFIHIRPAYLDADYIEQKYPRGGSALKNEIVPRLKELSRNLERKFPNVFFRIDKFEGYWTKKNYSKCLANPLIAVLSGDGRFLVCQDRGIRNEEEYLRWGNYNTDSFADIWWSPEHKKVMESINLDKCPRCVENSMNEIIEHCFLKDSMKMDLL